MSFSFKTESFRIDALALAGGFSALAAQTVFAKEFLSLEWGSELIVGSILAIWLFSSAMGSAAARSASESRAWPLAELSLFALGVLPFLSAFLARAFWNELTLPGVLPSASDSFLIEALFVAPSAFFAGFLFPWLVILAKRKSEPVSRIYSLETFGAAFGGVFATAAAAVSISKLSVLFISGSLNLAVLFFLAVASRKKIAAFAYAFVAIILTFAVALNIENFSTALLFKGQKIIYDEETKFGDVKIARLGDQLICYENSQPIAFSGDPIAAEENVLIALSQVDTLNRVAVIGRGRFGIIDAAAKAKPKKITVFEQNERLARVAEKYFPQKFSSAENVFGDPRLNLKKQEGKLFDAILIVEPPPYSLTANRFYSLEFFKLAKSRLTQGGVLALSFPSSENYLSANARNLSSIIYKTLSKVFKRVLIIPERKTLFLASDKELTYEIPAVLRRKKIKAKFVEAGYYNVFSVRFRAETFEKSLTPNAPVNRDFEPAATMAAIKSQLDYFGEKYEILLAVVSLPLLASFFFFGKIEKGIYLSGFASISFELVVLYAFQIVYGYAYAAIGAIAGIFMIGMALGAKLASRALSASREAIVGAVAINSCLIAVSPILFGFLNRFSHISVAVIPIFVFLALFSSVLFGAEFVFASRLSKNEVSASFSKLYSADLLGAALGACLFSLFFVPVFGLYFSSVIAATLNALAIAAFAKRR